MGLFDDAVKKQDLYDQITRVEDAANLVLQETARLRELVTLAPADAIQKAKPHPIKARLTRFDVAHKRRFQKPAPIIGAKDAAIMQRLLKQYTEDEIDGFIDQFFELDDNWTMGAGFTVGVFASSIGKLIAAREPRRMMGQTPRTEGNRQNATSAAALIRQQIRQGR